MPSGGARGGGTRVMGYGDGAEHCGTRGTPPGHPLPTVTTTVATIATTVATIATTVATFGHFWPLLGHF